MRRRSLVPLLGVLVLVGVLTSAPAAVAVKKIGLSSGSFQYNVAPGQSGRGEVVAIDDGDEPIKVFVYAADQKVDEKGGITYVVPNRDDPQYLNAPSSWVRLRMPESSKAIGNTPYVEMKPKDRVPVRFDFTVPPAATPGDYNVLVFFEMFDVSPDTGAAAAVAGRLGTRLKIRVQGEFIEDMEVRPFVVPKLVVGSEVPYTFLVRNQGNLDKEVSALVELQDTDGVTLASSVPMTDVAVYAATNREASGKVAADKLLFGAYKVRLTVSYPKESGVPGKPTPAKAVEERSTWVFPLWFVLLVAAIVLAFVLWIAWRSAVRAGARKARRERLARREANRTRASDQEDAGVREDSDDTPEPGEPDTDDPADVKPADEGPERDSGDRWADDIEF